MRHKLTMATLVLAVISAGLFTPSTASAAETSTPVAVNCTSTFGPLTGQFTIDTSAPDSVAPGATFNVHFDIAIGEFFGIAAPYDGTIDMQFAFSSSNAAPSGFTLMTPTTHFNIGDFFAALSLDQQLTATGAPGTTIPVQFLSFAYTIRPDTGGVLEAACQPAAIVNLGSIPIALPTPQSKADCKDGGWRDLVDAAGSPFRNQGQCVRTTVGAATR